MLPARQLKLVLAWSEIHKSELLKNWQNGVNNQMFFPIEPLK
jgi:hypothetical protein